MYCRGFSGSFSTTASPLSSFLDSLGILRILPESASKPRVLLREFTPHARTRSARGVWTPAAKGAGTTATTSTAATTATTAPPPRPSSSGCSRATRSASCPSPAETPPCTSSSTRSALAGVGQQRQRPPHGPPARNTGSLRPGRRTIKFKFNGTPSAPTRRAGAAMSLVTSMEAVRAKASGAGRDRL